MKFYIYEIDTMEVVAVYEGDTNEQCETMAAHYLDNGDEYGATYSPAFGFASGLHGM